MAVKGTAVFVLWGKLFVISYMSRGNYQAKPMFERTKTIF